MSILPPEKQRAPVRKRRADAGQIRVSQAELQQLRWIGDQYAIRIDTLRKLLSRESEQLAASDLMTERSVRRRIQRWREEGLIHYQVLLHRQPGWIWLTSEGLRRVGLQYRESKPNYMELDHLYYVGETRLVLEERYGTDLEWVGEREIWRRVNRLNPSVRKATHVPDGEVMMDGKIWAIEVELTQKASRSLRLIVDRLSSQYDRILYIAGPGAEATVKREIDSRTKNVADLFQVLSLADVVSRSR